MARKFEYKFVRLETTNPTLFFGVEVAPPAPAPSAREGYQTVVHLHAELGWRLVQIFTPPLGAHGAAAYYELIFEREVSEEPASSRDERVTRER
jgi:hypothetical protein